MIMASCLISTASTTTNTAAANKTNSSASSQAYLNGNRAATAYRLTRNRNYHQIDDITDESNEYDDHRNGDSTTISDVRIVKLRRTGNSPLGFSIRGGYEHGTGVFVSEVSPNSEAEREGLKVGDQILRVNGFSIEQAIHEEVIALIKSTPRIALKVKSIGLIPVKEMKTKCVSWKYVESSPAAVCPIHNRWPSKTALLSVQTPPSSSSSHSSVSETELFQNFSIADSDYMEAKVFVSLLNGQGLGCSVVKGPNSYPGIYVQVVKKGGVAEESGLEVGDQIIGINGTSLEPGDIEFNDAIAMIKSCQQMTLTVRKKSGLNLFRSHKQKIKALVHSNPADEFNGNGNNSSNHNQHSPLSSKQSISSSGSSDNPRYFDPSEHDFSMSEVESNGNDQIVKLPRVVNKSSWKQQEKNSSDHRVHAMPETNGADPSVIVSAKKMYEEVRKEEERLCEERKKLEAEQKRLQSELEKLEKERKQLENLKQDECKSISSASTVSGSQSVSSIGSANGSAASAGSASGSGSSSQISFLDEIKKLAEKRNGENGLITDTLNKTRNLHSDIANGVNKPKHFGPDGDKRKRHELLMEEFRAAHSKMFGNQVKQPVMQTQSATITSSKTSDLAVPAMQSIPCPPPLPNEVRKQQVSQVKSAPPQSTFVNDHGEKVTILKTTASPKKPPPPPVPTKKSSSPPILTISSYESNQPTNRFLVNECNNNNNNGINGNGGNHCNNRSVITVGGDCSNGRNDVSLIACDGKPTGSDCSPMKQQISIKISHQLSTTTSVHK